MYDIFRYVIVVIVCSPCCLFDRTLRSIICNNIELYILLENVIIGGVPYTPNKGLIENLYPTKQVFTKHARSPNKHDHREPKRLF